MQIHVRLQSGLADRAGIAHRSVVQMPDGSTVADLIQALQHRHPPLSTELTAAVAFMNGEHVTPDSPLAAEGDVALLLPIAGGAG